MFLLLSKDDCELCDQAKAVVQSTALLPGLDELNILEDTFLVTRYGWHIPVLVYMESGNDDNAEVNESELAEYLQLRLSGAGAASNKAGENIKPVYDTSGRAIELFWPFPPSRARQFIQQFLIAEKT